MDDLRQVASFGRLAQLAMRETGAAGFALYAYENGETAPVQLAACGLALPVTPREGLAVTQFDLQVQNRKVGLLAFVFHALAIPDGAGPKLDRLARTLEALWSLFMAPQTVIELAQHVSRRQAELADLKIAERAQGFLQHPQPDVGETMALHVECVLHTRRFEALLEQLAHDLEVQIEERKVIARAKSLLQSVHGVTEEEAYARLRLTSRRSRRRIFEVAGHLIRDPYDTQST
jgi:hypothetical protein